MTYFVWKKFRFSASHVLNGMPEGHQCGRLHGHNYVVEMELTDDMLDQHGFVKDFGDFAPIKKYIDDTLDHKHLNDVLEFNPTAELMAAHLFRIFSETFPQLCAVRIQETETSWAEYRR